MAVVFLLPDLPLSVFVLFLPPVLPLSVLVLLEFDDPRELGGADECSILYL